MSLIRRNRPAALALGVVLGLAVGGGTAFAAVDAGKDLAELSLAELQSFSTLIDRDVFDVLKVDGSVAARCHTGGTAPAQVRAQIKRHQANT